MYACGVRSKIVRVHLKTPLFLIFYGMGGTNLEIRYGYNRIIGGVFHE